MGLFKKRKKAVVVGLDGVAHSLVLEYMGRGLMPEFSRLAEKGRLLRMRSTLPEVSSVAWASFMTGKNPGEHGIFGFMEIDRQSYEYRFPDFGALREKPFWEKNGTRAVVVNIPQTYPARPFEGVLVSGFVAIDLKKAVYPERLYEYLNSMGYRLDVDSGLARQNPQAFFEDMFEAFRKRREAILQLYGNEDWGLFISAVTETDRLHHFFFDSALGGEHYDVFVRFYGELDRFLGEMARMAEKDGAAFFTCSDHGFTTIKTELYLNRWLMDSGYLELEGGREGLTGMTQFSRAFCLDPSRIYLHLEGKYGRGSVKPGEAGALVAELKERLEGLEFEGRRVVKKAYLKKEIFRGVFSDEGPDIYLLPNYGYDLKGSVRADGVFGRTVFNGMHTYDDAHLFVSKPLEAEDVGIEDVAEIISSYLK